MNVMVQLLASLLEGKLINISLCKIFIFEFYFILFYFNREQAKKAKGKPLKKSRDWIIEKKERRRRQGKETRSDTKFTGRKRSGRF